MPTLARAAAYMAFVVRAKISAVLGSVTQENVIQTLAVRQLLGSADRYFKGTKRAPARSLGLVVARVDIAVAVTITARGQIATQELVQTRYTLKDAFWFNPIFSSQSGAHVNIGQ